MAVLLTSGLLLVAYLIVLGVYRLYLSPLAKFPGPKAAALSKWYEAYYEIWKQGQFVFKIDELHDRYGPIVRITPNHLHIRDSSFFDTFYVKNPKAKRDPWEATRFGNEHSVFTTVDPVTHKMRRNALTGMFSRRAILNFESRIDEKVALLCQGIGKCKEEKRAFAISNAFQAFTGDVVTQYSFGFSYDHLKSKDFAENLEEPFMAVSQFGHTAVQFPLIATAFKSVPDSLMAWMNPPLRKLLQLRRDIRTTLDTIAANEKAGHAIPSHPTIFHSLLRSSLPDSEKNSDRLGDEAQVVLAAGVSTTAWSLSHAAFYLLDDATLGDKLRAELRTAIPDPSAPDAFANARLERLPYLGACVKEATRLSLGASSRLPRVLDEPLEYKDWVVPPKTVISMTGRDVHFDESIYRDAKAFRPERWLKEGGEELSDRFYVPFGKGVRMCLGMNLAYVEMYKALAAVFRLFDMDLYETDYSDIEMRHDYTLPSPRLDSKGVRVKVRGMEQCEMTRPQIA